MKRLQRDEIEKLEFHSISRLIPQGIDKGANLPLKYYEHDIVLVLLNGKIILDAWSHRRAIERGTCLIESYDQRKHRCDPITLALRANYLSPVQRAFAAARLLHSAALRIYPELIPFEALLTPALHSRTAADKFALKHWNVSLRTFQRSRAIVEHCTSSDFLEAITEGRISIAKAYDAVRALGNVPAVLDEIARVGNANLAIDRAIELQGQLPKKRRRARTPQMLELKPVSIRYGTNNNGMSETTERIYAMLRNHMIEYGKSPAGRWLDDGPPIERTKRRLLRDREIRSLRNWIAHGGRNEE